MSQSVRLLISRAGLLSLVVLLLCLGSEGARAADAATAQDVAVRLDSILVSSPGAQALQTEVQAASRSLPSTSLDGLRDKLYFVPTAATLAQQLQNYLAAAPVNSGTGQLSTSPAFQLTVKDLATFLGDPAMAAGFDALARAPASGDRSTADGATDGTPACNAAKVSLVAALVSLTAHPTSTEAIYNVLAAGLGVAAACRNEPPAPPPSDGGGGPPSPLLCDSPEDVGRFVESPYGSVWVCMELTQAYGSFPQAFGWVEQFQGHGAPAIVSPPIQEEPAATATTAIKVAVQQDPSRPLTVNLDFGDGTSASATVPQGSGSSTATFSHGYYYPIPVGIQPSVGVYTQTATIVERPPLVATSRVVHAC